VYLLLIAGHETTVNLIANGVNALLAHPGQLALLRAEPDRLPAAVEELLRFDSPAQVSIPALTAEPIEVAGVSIPAGENVVIALLAVNRDPARFAEPGVLDLGREDAGHLAFGRGVHHCLGRRWRGWRRGSRSARCWSGSTALCRPRRPSPWNGRRL
jgi:cytochrome P450